jgi:hypothetical protein
LCDYSLEAYASRPAEAGEDLKLGYFASGSKGFVAASDDKVECAVCLSEGTIIRLTTLDLAGNDAATDDVTFFHKEGIGAYRHKDSVRYADGREELLQNLATGSRATIIMIAKPGAKEDVELASPEPAPTYTDQELIA